MLVPLIDLRRSGMGQLECTSTPGPARLISPPFGLLPRFEKFATRSLESIAATAAIDRQLAGLETGTVIPTRRLLSFPAAAMINVPADSAREPATS